MKLKKIISLDARSFRNFKWENLTDFQQYNLIYGWNGTGKTTIGDVLAVIQRKQAGESIDLTQLNKQGIRDFTICTDEFNVIGLKSLEKGSPDLPAIRVFNAEYVKENVFTSEGPNSIIILGKKSKKLQDEIENLKNEIANKNSIKKSSEIQKENHKKNKDTLLTTYARTIKEILNYTTQRYDKRDLEIDIVKIEKIISSPTFSPISEDEYKKSKTLVNAEEKKKIIQINYIEELEPLFCEKIAELLAKTPVADFIDSLLNNAELSDWVSKGLKIHKNSYDTCQFCKQSIPKSRIEYLEKLFNETYDDLITEINIKIKQTNEYINKLSEIIPPHTENFYKQLSSDYEIALSAFNVTKELIIKTLKETKNKLSEKAKNPYVKVNIDVLEIPSLKEKIEKLNSKISEHEDIRCDFENKKEHARTKIRDYHANQIITTTGYTGYKEAIDTIKKDVESITKEILNHEFTLSSKEKEIEERRKPLEELNQAIEQYLGHSEIQIELSEDKHSLKYKIIRKDNKVATNLSEGEKTAIALMYFLQSLKDKGFDQSKGIVVLDDPISSLDEGALYNAYRFIRARTENVGQLFILTHNYTFFKLAWSWFTKSLPNGYKAEFYQTIAINDNKGKNSKIQDLPKLLKDYESEYHYKFSLVYKASKIEGNYGTGQLEAYYELPNIARRLLESFISFKRPGYSKTHSDMYTELGKISSGYDFSKRDAIIRFLNRFSHHKFFHQSESDLSGLEPTPELMRFVLELIEHVDKDHYNNMVALIEKNTQNEESSKESN